MTIDDLPCGGDCGSMIEDHIGLVLDGECVLFSDQPWWSDQHLLRPAKETNADQPAN